MGRGEDYITKSFIFGADQIKKNELGRSRGTHGIQETCEQDFGRGRDGKRPLKGSRRRWKDSIKIDVNKVGCGGLHWIALVQERDG